VKQHSIPLTLSSPLAIVALLPDKGKVTREEADKKSEEEYRLFDPTQRIDSDFDKEIRGLFDAN